MPPKRSLVEALDTAAPAAKKRRQLNRRTTDDAVDRLLREQFPTLSQQDTDLTTVNGMTLRQTLLQAKRDAKNGNKRLAAAYYKGLKDEFEVKQPGANSLKVRDPNEPVQPALVQALAASSSTNPAKRSKQPLYNFFSSCRDLNQKGTVGLLRSVADINVASSVAARKHVLEVIKFLVNSELHNKFKVEVATLSDLWDETLALTYVYMKRERMPTATWWHNFRGYVQILGDTTDYDRIMKEESGWANVFEPLMRVTRRSENGRKLFGGALELVSSERFSSALDAKLLELRGVKEIKLATINDLKDRMFLCLW